MNRRASTLYGRFRELSRLLDPHPRSPLRGGPDKALAFLLIVVLVAVAGFFVLLFAMAVGREFFGPLVEPFVEPYT